MAYINTPASLNQMFDDIDERISRLETGYNGPQQSADAAQSTATLAQTDATTAISNANVALAQATIAYTLAGTSLQKDANTITNSNNNMTAINANGITVYSGSSMSSGSRVVMNSAGIAGFNSSGSATFSINASTGDVSMTGALFTGGTIYGGQLNINGNCTIDTNGYLIATGATITGTIYATSGSFTGNIYALSGTIGGWTISSSQIYNGSGAFLNGSTGNIGGNEITAFNHILSYGIISTTSGASISSAGNITAVGSATFGQSSGLFEFLSSSGNVRVSSTYSQVASGRTMQITSAGLYGTASSTERKKHNVRPFKINKDALLQLEPVAFNYLESIDEEQNPEYGFIAEDADRLGLYPLVGYDKEGLPDYFAYEKLPIFLLQVIKDQEIRITKLEGK